MPNKMVGVHQLDISHPPSTKHHLMFVLFPSFQEYDLPLIVCWGECKISITYLFAYAAWPVQYDTRS